MPPAHPAFQVPQHSSIHLEVICVTSPVANASLLHPKTHDLHSPLDQRTASLPAPNACPWRTGSSHSSLLRYRAWRRAGERGSGREMGSITHRREASAIRLTWGCGS